MRLPARLSAMHRKLGRLERLFLLVVVVWLLAPLGLPSVEPFLRLALFLFGSWVVIRLARRGMRKALWRLRNRLYVSYLFIAVVPMGLLLVLGVLGAWMYTSQVAIFLVTSELERRTASLKSTAAWLAEVPPKQREETIRQIAPYLRQRFPGSELLVRDGGERRYPEGAAIDAPPSGWGEAGGLVMKRGRLYGWARAVRGATEITLLAPLPSDYLSEMVPDLGEVDYLEATSTGEAPPAVAGGPVKLKIGGRTVRPAPERPRDGRKDHLPPPANRFDVVVWWFSRIPAAVWEEPGLTRSIVLAVRSRPSAVLNIIASQRASMEQSLLPSIFLGISILLLIVEFVSLIIGVSLNRTITRAVHQIYEGTQKVKEGDFRHRIPVEGSDQLAELGQSFNSMIENLEQLLAVAKEKERLQSELEIAREVQNQLYPRSVPELKTLRITARCNPARMVSGDYYDYQAVGDKMVALAIGDVAGKGISAALLMATVESSVRTQIRACLEAAQASGNGGPEKNVSTSRLVAQLNQQLFAHTSPEKYATFCFGVYDDATGLFTYTNAGHLPPILLRRGEPITLDVNGMVVGAFPFAEYQESRVHLESGDLLVCYTDGVTEPENVYGEMFGEERLIGVLARHAGSEPDEIINAVTAAVTEWTGAGELQDDMTLLVARRT